MDTNHDGKYKYYIHEVESMTVMYIENNIEKRLNHFQCDSIAVYPLLEAMVT